MGDLAYWPAAKPLSKKNTFAKNRDFIKNLDHICLLYTSDAADEP